MMDAQDRYDSLIRWFWEQHTAPLHPEPDDWRLVKAQVRQESNFDPAAVSPVGALGLLQLMPATAEELGLKINGPGGPFWHDERRNPERNLEAGIRHLADCWRIWRDEHGLERWKFALGSYNAGEGNILKAQALAGERGRPTDQWIEIAAVLPEVTTPAHAQETIGYVRAIVSTYLAWRTSAPTASNVEMGRQQRHDD